MFSIVKSIRGNKDDKAVQTFLSSLLIEVATENYRQLMFEQLMLSTNKSDKETLLDPPLRANERVMSGLFANAISKVAARSKPEVRVDRQNESEDETEGEDYGQDNDSNDTSAGRVDFLAWHNRSTIALELKVAYVNWSSESPAFTEATKRRWKGVVDQTDSAQNALKLKDEERYPDPHSIGLLVLVSRSAKRATEETFVPEKHITAIAELTKKLGEDATGRKKDNPHFIATYTFPAEFRNFVRKRKGKENDEGEQRSTPFVTFIAYVAQ